MNNGDVIQLTRFDFKFTLQPLASTEPNSDTAQAKSLEHDMMEKSATVAQASTLVAPIGDLAEDELTDTEMPTQVAPTTETGEVTTETDNKTIIRSED